MQTQGRGADRSTTHTAGAGTKCGRSLITSSSIRSAIIFSVMTVVAMSRIFLSVNMLHHEESLSTGRSRGDSHTHVLLPDHKDSMTEDDMQNPSSACLRRVDFSRSHLSGSRTILSYGGSMPTNLLTIFFFGLTSTGQTSIQQSQLGRHSAQGPS